MLRAVGSIVAGFIVFAVALTALTFGAFMAMGPDRAFEPGAFDHSLAWSAAAAGCGLLAAVIGGIVCSWIARSGVPAKALAALVLCVGLASAGAGMTVKPGKAPAARTADTPFADLLTNARDPAWASLANPVVGALGILMGSAARRRVTGAAPAAGVIETVSSRR